VPPTGILLTLETVCLHADYSRFLKEKEDKKQKNPKQSTQTKNSPKKQPPKNLMG